MFSKIIHLSIGLSFVGCTQQTLPKPYGELRLEYPEPHYRRFESPCGYQFEYSDFARVEPAKGACWYYINYPKMKAKVSPAPVGSKTSSKGSAGTAKISPL